MHIIKKAIFHIVDFLVSILHIDVERVDCEPSVAEKLNRTSKIIIVVANEFLKVGACSVKIRRRLDNRILVHGKA